MQTQRVGAGGGPAKCHADVRFSTRVMLEMGNALAVRLTLHCSYCGEQSANRSASRQAGVRHHPHARAHAIG